MLLPSDLHPALPFASHAARKFPVDTSAAVLRLFNSSCARPSSEGADGSVGGGGGSGGGGSSGGGNDGTTSGSEPVMLLSGRCPAIDDAVE